jgi:tRNA A-37 threonylcarbamoyl transferase component Bud32
MNSKCKPPKCKFDEKANKCIKPNAYIEALAWCTRNGMNMPKCKKLYEEDKQKAQVEACNRYDERILHKKSPKNRVFLKDILPDTKTQNAFTSIVQQSSNSLSPKIKKFKQKYAAKKIKAFLNQKILNRFNNIENRLAYYKYIQQFLQGTTVNYCLENKTYNGVNGFKIGDKLYLIKRIGTASVCGIIYKTVAKNVILSLVTKLMISTVKENINEVRMNKFITEIVKMKLSRHFLLTYKEFECQQNDNVNVPDIIKNKKYYMVLNELAHGDLKDIVTNNICLSNTEVIFNILIQCILSVATLHSYTFLHNDCHWGNFLFHITKSQSGYYHYNIYGKDYYLKDCGYNIMIYDFGLIEKYDDSGMHKNLSIKDYRRILPFFMLQEHTSMIEKDWKGVITNATKTDTIRLKPLSLFCQNLEATLFRKIMTDAKLNNEISVIGFILDEIQKFNVKNKMESIFTDVKQPTMNVINNKPFTITTELSNIKHLIPKVLKQKRGK